MSQVIRTINAAEVADNTAIEEIWREVYKQEFARFKKKPELTASAKEWEFYRTLLNHYKPLGV